MNKIHVIGLGIELGSPRQEIIRLIHASDLLVGGKRLLKRFEDYKGKVLEIKGPLEEIVKTIKEEWSQGRKVVVLADGDPLFFGIGKRLLAEMDGDQLEFIPSITTVQMTAARAKIPWDNWRVVSIHGREDIWPLVRALTFSDMVGVYTANDQGPSVIATVMKERNIDTFRMMVFENLAHPDERIRDVSLDEVQDLKFSPLNFVLLRRVKRPAVALSVGLSDELYVHDRGMITKKEIRAIGLASLAIKPTDTIWDLGAGSGAVAIEASCLAREGKVFAVERNTERVGWIRENIKRTGAYLVEVVEGEMPRCLDLLPSPDKVFLGGGMLEGDELIKTVCDRLENGGRLVAHTVVMESAWRIKQHLERLGWPFEVIQVNVARSARIAGDIRLDALNPVSIIVAEKRA